MKWQRASVSLFCAQGHFLHKWTRVPDDYEEIYQQVLREMQQPDFVATLDLLTAWEHPKDQSESDFRGFERAS